THESDSPPPLTGEGRGARETGATMEPEKTARGSVMIIDDDDRIRQSLADLLDLEGYEVITAGNGQEALNYLRRLPLPSLILLDVMMPIMDGWEFRSQLLKDEKLASIPVVITSSISAAYQLKGHLQSVSYLEKPFDSEQLLALVKRYCG